MKQGQFYFISDDFYTLHDPLGKLMQNKDGAHNRPCFYAFPDTQEPAVFWCVPISSQVSKFKEIFHHKIEKQLIRGVKSPKCSTIRFGQVMGQERAFLIQNMFPITQQYITSTYIDRNTHNPVTIDPQTERDVLSNARDVLKLVFRGSSNLVFSDIVKTRSELIAEVQQEKAVAITPNTQTAEAPASSLSYRLAAAKQEAAKQQEPQSRSQHKQKDNSQR